MPNTVKSWIVGMGGALALLALTSIHLGYQGAYYDELHQAPSAFWHVGRNPALFHRVFNGIPLLNTTYGGAIKSHVYGLYLRSTSRGFSIESWRLLGILVAAAGIAVFCGISGRYLAPGAVAVFVLLLLTDSSVLLATRYDHGPAVLALALRLLLLATWISLAAGERTQRKVFAAGLITGLAIFEKLVAVVLLGLCL